MKTKQTTLDIFHREDENIEIGDIVATTTAEFDYNGLTHTFDKEATTSTLCVVEWVDDDYSEFDPDKCRNGGCYGFDYYKVISILDVPNENARNYYGYNRLIGNVISYLEGNKTLVECLDDHAIICYNYLASHSVDYFRDGVSKNTYLNIFKYVLNAVEGDVKALERLQVDLELVDYNITIQKVE